MPSIRVVSAKPLPDACLLITFNNGITKTYDTKNLFKEYQDFEVLKNPDIFNLVQVEPGGYGIYWSPELDCSEGELWENSTPYPNPV